jgi:hypothetical protein
VPPGGFPAPESTPDAVVAAVETEPPALVPAPWTAPEVDGLAPLTELATFCATALTAAPAVEPALETACATEFVAFVTVAGGAGVLQPLPVQGTVD